MYVDFLNGYKSNTWFFFTRSEFSSGSLTYYNKYAVVLVSFNIYYFIVYF